MDGNSSETEKLISSFTNITSSSRETAISFLETHQWNLNAAVSTFTKNEATAATTATTAEPNVPNPNDDHLLRPNLSPFPNLRINIPVSSFSPFDGSSGYSPSRSRFRSPSPPRFYLHSKREAANPFGRETSERRRDAGEFSGGTGNDSDDALGNYGREDGDRDVERSEEPARSMSAETVSDEFEEEIQDMVTHIVTIWRNGFTFDDSELKTLDDAENATFLEAISKMESPRELNPVRIQVILIRREEENFTQESQASLHGVGGTLAGSDSASTEPTALAVSPPMSFDGMLVQEPRKAKDVDAIFDRVEESVIERPEQSSRLMSEDTVSDELQEEQQEDEPYEVVKLIVTIWKNGYTVVDSELKSFDDPENATFLERVTSMESPRLYGPVRVQVKLIRREENFTGVETSLAGSDSVSTESPSPSPSMGLIVVDPAAPTTSIELRLADGTRFVTQFNTHHTVGDIRAFIDASRPDGFKDYHLSIMGSPPTLLPDFNQTIEEAGIIANSVLVQNF
ncbi:plant UBX domain-containing protein 6 [Capsella rubella]|uniref:plant UBX domain-containing protein 6 n=1 Tax=Capsella rubella TaxID=81985 RepID=UPI000CD4EDE5|nr:plant UBX domain-containing protein 6 [Capsella rubella]